jgi:hypothetical protein
MCQVLEVSRSRYYHWLKEPLSKRKMKDMELKEEIRRIYDKNRKRAVLVSTSNYYGNAIISVKNG